MTEPFPGPRSPARRASRYVRSQLLTQAVQSGAAVGIDLPASSSAGRRLALTDELSELFSSTEQAAQAQHRC